MAVKPRELLGQLEERCLELGIKVIYDELQTEGGLCRLRDCWYVIINRRTATETRARIITDALARLEAEAVRPTPVETVVPGTVEAEVEAAIKAEGRP